MAEQVVIRGQGFNEWPACWVAYTRRYGPPIGGVNAR